MDRKIYLAFLLLICFGACVAFDLNLNCVCKQPKKTGVCKAYIPSWFYNARSGLCEKFIYGGCGGNANRFETKEECVRICGCSANKKVGPCLALFPRWYFTNGSCKKFFYGGCQGNENNFRTKRQCTKACS